MKALSLLQPWASLVIMGAKKIETRSWQTPFRGDLLIHASFGKKGGILVSEAPFKKYIKKFETLPFGAIIGKVILEDIIPVNELLLSQSVLANLTLEEKAFGDYGKGRYAWILSEPEAFNEIIPVRGTLGLWNFELCE